MPHESRLWAWTGHRLPRSRVFWMTVPASFALLTATAYMEGVGHFRCFCGSILNPLHWWPYYLTGNPFVGWCLAMRGVHCGLVSHPLEFSLSVFWWLIMSIVIATVVSRAWSRRARLMPWVEANAGILATFFAFLWIIALLAHLRDTGYTHAGCSVCYLPVEGVSDVSLSWVFWWPFHVVGLGCFCGRGPLDYPFLYLASFLWWLLLSWFLARLTLPGLREFRENPPFRLKWRRRLPPRQKARS